MNSILSSAPNITISEILERVSSMGALLQQHAAEERANRRLSRTVIRALQDAGLFRLYVPVSVGGLEADPLTVARITEKVAHYNTAAGWALMVANTSAWWCSKLSEEGTDQIYADGPDTFIAGAFHPPMKATQVAGGYIINGRSPLASNVNDAKWIFTTALVMEKGQPVMSNDMPQVIGAIVNGNDCQILDTWYTIGMNATNSNDFCVNDVFVPTSLAFPLIPAPPSNTFYRGSLYRFPAIGAGVASLIIPVALAVARNAVEELKMLAGKKVPLGSATAMKDRGTVQRKLGMAEALIQCGRAYLHQEIAACWEKTLNDATVSMTDRARLFLAATHTNQSCAQAVEQVYSASGSSGFYKTNPLANYFTDAQVIKQHGFSNESRYETAAQVYLGLQPDLPVIMF